MRPKTFNDLLAILVLVLMAAMWLVLSRTGLAVEQQGLIIGASIVWIGQIVTHYWRKAPPSNGTPP